MSKKSSLRDRIQQRKNDSLRDKLTEPWTFRGRLLVVDRGTSDTPQRRPLAGVEVEVQGSALHDRGWTLWKRGETDANGRFRITDQRLPKQQRYLRLRVRFRDEELEIGADPSEAIKEGELRHNWHTIYTSSRKLGPSSLPHGDFVFDGAKKVCSRSDLGDVTSARTALAWYVCRRVMGALRQKSRWLGFTKRVHVVYPSRAFKYSWANGLNHTMYLVPMKGRTPEGFVRLVLHELMHHWNYQHNSGTTNWIKAVCGDHSTHSLREEPNVAFHEGFAEYAAHALLTELWGRAPKRPYSRGHLYRSKVRTLEQVERWDDGVMSALRLLTAPRPWGIYGLEMGDAKGEDLYAQRVSAGALEGLDIPRTPCLDFWDVLTAFRARDNSRWSKDWEVGRSEYGLMRFLRRVRDLYPDFTGEQHRLLLELLDPGSEVEAQDELGREAA